jgi:hypothetical protein
VEESKEMKDYRVRRYSFEELGEGARERAIREMREALYEVVQEGEVTEYLTDCTYQALGGREEEIKLAWSLSYSQGDGVAIYGVIRRENAPDLSWPEGAQSVHLVRNSWSNHYSHYNSFDVEVYDAEDDTIEDVRIIETQLRDICRQLERDGYKYIEGCTTEEVALEQLKDAGDVFTIEGAWNMPTGIVEEEEAK